MISEKIIVVDDDLRVIKSIKLALVEYEIISFQSGEEALEYLKNPNSINLVLLDVMMPGMDGLSVLSEIKKLNKDVGVIIMTAYGSKDIVLQALRNHADDFVEKPFKIEELKEKIKQILKERMYFNKSAHDRGTRVQRIKNFIDRNISNVSLECISNELCLSPKYISRMFNEKSDTGFRDYKVKVKIDRAKSMLEETSLNINQISLELGYQNPESFMRIFKRITELTPMQYRKKYEQKLKR